LSLLNAGDREKVADVLERETDFVIHEWMGMVEKQEDLMHISVNRDERTDHLPQLLRDVIARLRLDVCTKTPIPVAAGHHGDLRRKQGYTVAMMIEESRLLQVCLFTRTEWFLHLSPPGSIVLIV
jgi:hypothetical protein